MSEYLCVRRDHLQAVYDAALDTDESGLASHAEPMRAVCLILASPGYPVPQRHAAGVPPLDGGAALRHAPASLVRQLQQLAGNLGGTVSGKFLLDSAGLERIAHAAVEPYAEVFRELASWLGAGGFNAEVVDPKVFEEKIRWGVNHLAPGAELPSTSDRRVSQSAEPPTEPLMSIMDLGADANCPLCGDTGHIAVSDPIDAPMDTIACPMCAGQVPEDPLAEAVEGGDRHE
ncbi:hypothetical protein [Pseudomonas aeruginosa]|uniref:hypothetical protein n=1 Tax=Pseudomonas aeruginosa TaxID=287 RepID=UPI00287FBDBB|nr:hypothetical protein [Pseudomonas aeruginosa]